jgi:hypothetical protein
MTAEDHANFIDDYRADHELTVGQTSTTSNSLMNIPTKTKPQPISKSKQL